MLFLIIVLSSLFSPVWVGAHFQSVRVDQLYACSERWDRMASSRRCPPFDGTPPPVAFSPQLAQATTTPTSWYDLCLQQNSPNFDQQICSSDWQFRSRLEEFALLVDDRLPSRLMSSAVKVACSNQSSATATLRDIVIEVAASAFLGDTFVAISLDRTRQVQSMTRHYLCHGWLNFSTMGSIMEPTDSTISHLANELTLTSFLKCAGDLHRAAVSEAGYISISDKIFVTTEIVTGVLAVLACVLNVVSIIGVWFALGLSRFRRSLMLNLVITDLANVLTIAIDDNFNLPRALDASYYVWSVLTYEMILTLCLLTLDFNLAIFKPDQYEVLLPRAATFSIIAGSWLCSVGLALLFILGAKQHSQGLAIAVLSCYVLGIVIVFTAHLILILKIFAIHTSHDTVALDVPADHQQHKSIVEQTRRVSATIALCAFTTLILVTPYLAYEFNLLLEDIDPEDPQACIVNESHRLLIEMVADISLCVNCVIDPLLYVMRLTDVRKGLRRAWHKFLRLSGLAQRYPLYANGLMAVEQKHHVGLRNALSSSDGKHSAAALSANGHLEAGCHLNNSGNRSAPELSPPVDRSLIL